jgi:hypothetical protein
LPRGGAPLEQEISYLRNFYRLGLRCSASHTMYATKSVMAFASEVPAG